MFMSLFAKKLLGLVHIGKFVMILRILSVEESILYE